VVRVKYPGALLRYTHHFLASTREMMGRLPPLLHTPHFQILPHLKMRPRGSLLNYALSSSTISCTKAVFALIFLLWRHICRKTLLDWVVDLFLSFCCF
jgi:hypothetical protein